MVLPAFDSRIRDPGPEPSSRPGATWPVSTVICRSRPKRVCSSGYSSASTSDVVRSVRARVPFLDLILSVEFVEKRRRGRVHCRFDSPRDN